jgi:integrase
MKYFGPMSVSQIDGQTWETFREWLNTSRQLEGRQPLSEATIHQLKNSVRLVLKEAFVGKAIGSIPQFADVNRSKRIDSRPRTHFNTEESSKLMHALITNLAYHSQKRTRWLEDSKELLDYVYFMEQTGLRVSEAKQLRFRDIRVVKDTLIVNGEEQLADILHILVRGGKLGGHPPCVSSPFAVDVFENLIKRRGISDPKTSEEPLFLKHHREAFKAILRKNNLYIDSYGRKRDFVSLRHTYIYSRLKGGASIFDVARNTRTSPDMIHKRYAASLGAASRRVNVW